MTLLRLLLKARSNCYNYYDVTTYDDGSQTWTYLFTACDESGDNSEAGGSGSNNDPPPAPDCSSVQNQFTGEPTATLLYGDVYYGGPLNPGVIKPATYSWTFYQSTLGLWSYNSTEAATLFLDGNKQWEFKTLTHGSLSLSGAVIGGTLTMIETAPAVATLGKYSAAMTLTYVLSASAICKGSPITFGSDVNTSTGYFTAN